MYLGLSKRGAQGEVVVVGSLWCPDEGLMLGCMHGTWSPCTGMPPHGLPHHAQFHHHAYTRICSKIPKNNTKYVVSKHATQQNSRNSSHHIT